MRNQLSFSDKKAYTPARNKEVFDNLFSEDLIKLQ